MLSAQVCGFLERFGGIERSVDLLVHTVLLHVLRNPLQKLYDMGVKTCLTCRSDVDCAAFEFSSTR